MNGWQLEPANIQKILTDTAAHVQEVGAAIESAGGEAGHQLLTGAGFDGVVVQAFTDFFQEQSTSRLQPLLNRYGAAVEATAKATNAFLAGDEQMADSTVALAGGAASTADVTGFKGGK